ncbi:MAG TPA: ABC transporter permease, partial [Bacteroidales bacterium]|nr:ABC transporter permease [Bacteroidales bacterium]
CDHTSLSRKIIRMVDATPIARTNTRYTSTVEARQALNAGETEAVVVIPAGTEREVIRGREARVAVYLNNVYLIKAGLLKSGIQKALATVSAGIRQQNRLMSGESRQQAMGRIQAIQLTPVLLFNPYTSYEYYLTLLILPVLLTVFILFGSIYSLGTELQYGSGPGWLEAAGGNIFIALSGKFLPHTVCFTGMALVMDLFFFQVLGLPLNGHFALILVSEILMILSYQSMAVFIVTLTRNLRLALSLASAYTMLAITYAGLTYPGFGMPPLAQLFSKIFPFTYWLDHFIGQTLRGEPVSLAIVTLLPLFIFLAAGLSMLPLLKHELQHEKFWYKI